MHVHQDIPRAILPVTVLEFLVHERMSEGSPAADWATERAGFVQLLESLLPALPDERAEQPLLERYEIRARASRSASLAATDVVASS